MNTRLKSLSFAVIALGVLALGASGCDETPDYTVEMTAPPLETVTFQNDDITLAGTLDLPAGEGPFPAVVLTHGSPPMTRYEFFNLNFSAFFVQNGFAVLRYDKRGSGESTGEHPYIDPEDSGQKLNALADDAIAGVEFLKNHDMIDPSMIGVAGLSQGGWIAPLAASKSSDVAFAIAFSGPTSSVGQEIFYSDLTEQGKSLQEASDMARDYEGPHGYTPVSSLQNLDVPGLWFFGGQDNSIPVPLSIEILDSLIDDQGKDFSYIVYPSGDHGLRDVETLGYHPYLMDALNWIEETLGH